jgi:hypothetical protein
LAPALSPAPAPVPEALKTITVDQHGGGDFRHVQSAVNFVPDGNREWIRIHVKSGSYRYIYACVLSSNIYHVVSYVETCACVMLVDGNSVKSYTIQSLCSRFAMTNHSTSGSLLPVRCSN